MRPELYIPNRVAGLWCRVVGHRWQPIAHTSVSVAQVCLRCRENGWRLFA